MTDKSKLPLPAVTANSGPFTIYDSKDDSNYCVYPNKKTNGILSVPLDNRPDHLAIRLHEYGHLQLISSGFHARNLPRIAFNKKIDGPWFQSSLDVIVNAFLIRQGCQEIKDLPLRIPKKSWPSCLVAQAFLRSGNLKVESGIRSRAHAVLSEDDIKFLRVATTKLNNYSLQTKLPTKEFFSLIRRLIKRFRDNPIMSRDFWGTLEDEDLSENSYDDKLLLETAETLLDKSNEGEITDFFSTEKKFKSVIKNLWNDSTYPADWNKWGKIKIDPLPLVESHPTRKNARKVNPGYVGAFRYPHRALLPASDGMAFAHRKKAKGGTVLLDCSGSMGLNISGIMNLLNHAPMLTIAAYAGDDSYRKGSLTILAKNGLMASKKSVEQWHRSLSGGNVIDGPAIQWLIKQSRPHIWVSDGMVTGINDSSSDSLDLEIMLLKKIGRIKQFETIKSCLQAFKKGFVEIDK